MMRMMFLILLMVSAVECLLSANDLTVNTTVGQIRGASVRVESVNHVVFQFKGIRYALPPTGQLRFMPSQPMQYNHGTFNATKFGHVCPQEPQWFALLKQVVPDAVQDEDCLSLNVYVPEILKDDVQPLAVMIWFHGGALLFGSGSYYDPSILASVGGVIVVTVNYRLGVLGYLTNEESGAIGNYGLWDQHLAIKWVRKNAANFGGDPENITIFGQSAGAYSVSLHTLIPRNVGLFKRAISESGSALIPGAIVERPRLWYKLFTQKIGCNDTEGTQASAQVLECLRSKSVPDIMRVQIEMEAEAAVFLTQPAIGKYQWGAWVDGDLIPMEPAVMIQRMSENRFNHTVPLTNIDLINGVNSQEGATFYAYQLNTYKLIKGLKDTFEGIPRNIYEDFMRSVVTSVTGNNQSAFTDMYEVAIDHEYNVDKTKESTNIEKAIRFSDVLSDLTFNMGVISFVRVHASFNHKILMKANPAKTFLYYYDHRGSWKSKENFRSGADHADEVDFVFGLPFALGLRSSSGEKSLSSAMIILWSNFAKTGDPNKPVSVQLPATWPEFTIEKEEYLMLRDDYTNVHPVGRQLHHSRMFFWTDYFPRLRDAAPKTCH